MQSIENQKTPLIERAKAALTKVSQKIVSAKLAMQTKTIRFVAKCMQRLEENMIHPMQKGVEMAKLQTPDPSTFGEFDLSTLPKYVCYKAALQKEKTTYQTISLALLLIFGAFFLYSRVEVGSYAQMLRNKEYILAPGSFDFTPVRTGKVSNEYVQRTVDEYLVLLGNVTPDAIEDQYGNLRTYMSSDLSARFAAESLNWVSKVKKESITETIQVLQKEVESGQDNKYRVRAQVKRSIFANNDFLNSEEEIIEMRLKLVLPSGLEKKNWYLQIESLSRNKVKAKEGAR